MLQNVASKRGLSLFLQNAWWKVGPIRHIGQYMPKLTCTIRNGIEKSKRYICRGYQNCILIYTYSRYILKLGCAGITSPCTVAARYFAHLSVVNSRQRSNGVLWLLVTCWEMGSIQWRCWRQRTNGSALPIRKTKSLSFRALRSWLRMACIRKSCMGICDYAC